VTFFLKVPLLPQFLVEILEEWMTNGLHWIQQMQHFFCHCLIQKYFSKFEIDFEVVQKADFEVQFSEAFERAGRPHLVT